MDASKVENLNDRFFRSDTLPSHAIHNLRNDRESATQSDRGNLNPGFVYERCMK